MQAKHVISLLVTTAFWGTTFPFAKKVLETLTPIGYTTMIMLFGFAFLVGCLVVQGKVKTLKPAWQGNRRLILILGLVILPAALLVQYFTAGLVPSTAIHLSIITNLQAIFVMVINTLIFKEIMTKRSWGGAALAFIGVYFVIAGPTLSIFDASTIAGDLLGVLIGAIWAIYTAFGKKVVSNYDPLATTTLLFALCLVVTGSSWVVEGSIPRLADLTAAEWAMLAFIGICAQGLGFALWYNACSAVPSEKVALFINVSPLTTILLEIFWLGETFTWTIAVGFVLTIIGLYIAETGGTGKSVKKAVIPTESSASGFDE